MRGAEAMRSRGRRGAGELEQTKGLDTEWIFAHTSR